MPAVDETREREGKLISTDKEAGKQAFRMGAQLMYGNWISFSACQARIPMRDCRIHFLRGHCSAGTDTVAGTVLRILEDKRYFVRRLHPLVSFRPASGACCFITFVVLLKYRGKKFLFHC